MKDFSDLKSLQKALKNKQEAERREQEVRRQKEKVMQRDADLFRSTMNDVKPINNGNRVAPAHSKPPPLPLQRLADEKAALRESLSDEFDVESLLETDADLSFARNGISRDVVRKLRRGHWVLQDELDLHGLRRDDARETLGEFLRKSESRGLRCVRIIHGKGLGSINQEPVLKKLVHSWLMQKEEVLAFCQAKPADGGSGALVVLLKGRSPN